MRHTVSAALAGAGAFALLAAAAPALAFDDRSVEQPWGLEYGEAERPFEPGTRDANGNRVVVDGRILDQSSTLPMGLGLGFSEGEGFGLNQGQAIGNQLNVVTNGSFNTVIIDNTQINTGDQTVVVTGGQQ